MSAPAHEFPAVVPLRHLDAAPSRVGTGVGAVVGLVATVAALALFDLKLPYDDEFTGVAYLMWSGNFDQGWITRVLAFGTAVIAFDLALLALYDVARWNRPRPLRVQPLFRFARHFAPAFGLLMLLGLQQGRFVANAIYAFSSIAAWDLTPALARLEGSWIARLQAVLASPELSRACAILYSTVWIVQVHLAIPVLALFGSRVAVRRTLAGYFLVPWLAVPFFVLFRVFEPWITNPAFAARDHGSSLVRFLIFDLDGAMLRRIASEFEWSAASCLPSLHVTIPLVTALIAWRTGFRRFAGSYLALAAVTTFVVVYLGRHWLTDAVFAVPFAYGAVRLVEYGDGRLFAGRERDAHA